MLRAGTLRHRIQIQEQGKAVNEWNEPIPDEWTNFIKLWGDIRQPSGLAAIKADAQTSIVRTSIRIRYRTNVKAGMRAVHGNDVYDIKNVLKADNKREYVDLVCEQRT